MPLAPREIQYIFNLTTKEHEENHSFILDGDCHDELSIQ